MATLHIGPVPPNVSSVEKSPALLHLGLITSYVNSNVFPAALPGDSWDTHGGTAKKDKQTSPHPSFKPQKTAYSICEGRRNHMLGRSTLRNVCTSTIAARLQLGRIKSRGHPIRTDRGRSTHNAPIIHTDGRMEKGLMALSGITRAPLHLSERESWSDTYRLHYRYSGAAHLPYP
ncbi:hypothetical protein BABINDRAFT_80111 [Babjeviella inositovora NRRL Y-12698]|uniref:Uncharacterized protein n=1 Tax=Babjeviella inositovora NRRL Y-12698 TaxID=984486 RepID=A0A1E3QZF2_9ASCO|nr:uncharacterized protein BABINDRAFT_80111 [Babjeviella inositovora NRRL Y-12698]ODQ83050.1 hypothetical protein BABINDRAFT_80111 [Babjeviella inositovora NRRL Y-12698]